METDMSTNVAKVTSYFRLRHAEPSVSCFQLLPLPLTRPSPLNEGGC